MSGRRLIIFLSFFFFFLNLGAPIVVSFPHFYQADPMYINAIDGLSPNKDEHETYLDLQPVRLLFIIPRDCRELM